ncbi:DUF6644 family protein [Paracidovorax citrulli]
MSTLALLAGLGEAVAATPLSAALRASPWAYPLLEVIHLVGLGLLFGSIAVVDLRLAGLWRSLPITTLLPGVLPLTVAAFLAMAASGGLLLVAHADELATNPALLVKLGLIGVGLLNAAVFHVLPYRRLHGGLHGRLHGQPGSGAAVIDWNTGAAPPAGARIAAIVSLAVWTLVIAAGRLIAYV